MTDEEKKELQDLRDMKELQELRRAKAETINVSQSKEKKKSGCACLPIIGFCLIALLGFIIIAGSIGGSSRSRENYNDNSSMHQILAKNYFKDHLKAHMKDPDSYDEIAYTSTWNSYRECYVVDLKYRARNSFGGMVIERYIGDVTFKDGRVSFSNINKLE